MNNDAIGRLRKPAYHFDTMKYDELEKYSTEAADDILTPATLRNHVVVPDSREKLECFLGKTLKMPKRQNSHSEDALTWSCFDVLRNLPARQRMNALNRIMEDAFQGNPGFEFDENDNVIIEIGKEYKRRSADGRIEDSELDASIEIPGKLLLFIEAKLYSTLSPPDPERNRLHNQIAHKIRIGVSNRGEGAFYFIFLDLAPLHLLYLHKGKDLAKDPSGDKEKFFGKSYYKKWTSAWWFNYYKNRPGLTPLRNVLEGTIEEKVDGKIKKKTVLDSVVNGELYAFTKDVSQNMGWLTWSDLYKTVLQGLVDSTKFPLEPCD